MVGCRAGGRRSEGGRARSSGVVMELSRAAAGRQQGSERGRCSGTASAALECSAARAGRRKGGGESKGGKVNYLTRFKFKIFN